MESIYQTGDRTGWSIDDAEAAFARGDGVYWLPSREQRETLRVNDHAKLVFRRNPERGGGTEAMWVVLTDKNKDTYVGVLDNDPQLVRLKRGDPVQFSPADIIDIMPVDGIRASDADEDVVHCSKHGPSQMTFVCEHLASGAENQGFVTAANSEQRRPDAWCFQCDKLLEGTDSWDEASGHPRIVVLCGGCYDAAERRNDV